MIATLTHADTTRVHVLVALYRGGIGTKSFPVGFTLSTSSCGTPADTARVHVHRVPAGHTLYKLIIFQRDHLRTLYDIIFVAMVGVDFETDWMAVCSDLYCLCSTSQRP